MDSILDDARLGQLRAYLGRAQVRALVRTAINESRQGIQDPDELVNHVLERAPSTSTGLTPIINATGVIVHTNLGRAPLSLAARRAMVMAAGTVDVELDLATGARGTRGASTVMALLESVPGASAVHIVNNGAAALVLVAAALASDREIVIARGEMVEIGDQFRIPDLLTSAGARIREVGATNRVHRRDYLEAVGADTAFVLKVHPSNFKVEGYASAVSGAELSNLAVPLVSDIGSGLLRAHPLLPREPNVEDALHEGVDLVICSGDKLLGGPQCGLIFARDPSLLDLVARHPLARALRLDKIRLAALEATLRGSIPPIQQYLESRPEQLKARAQTIVDQLGPAARARVVETTARVGGGGAPEVRLPSAAVSLPPGFEEPLRLQRPRGLLGRLKSGRLLLDLIAVQPDDDSAILSLIGRVSSP